MHHQHLEAKAAAGRRARMQDDPAVGTALVPANSNQMGSHITSDCCVQRSCSAKLYALRSGRHGGQREQRLSRPSHDLSGKTEMQVRKAPTVVLVVSGRVYRRRMSRYAASR